MAAKGNGFVLFGALAATLALTPLASYAQDTQPGGPPGGAQPGRFGGQRGQGGGFGRGQNNQPVTLATAPIEALASGLKLTAEQKQQITEIQAKLPARGRGRGGAGAGAGGGTDFQAQRQQRQQLEQAATTQIEALLTAEQKTALPGVLKDIQTLRAAGLPVALLGSLGLTAEQKTKIADINAKAEEAMRQRMTGAQPGGDFQAMRESMQQARAETQRQVMAVLTDAQKAQVEKYRSEHPEAAGRGGFGGGGRNRGNRPGGAQGGV